ncbi:MAG: hypothetical protein CMN30_20860 [Sandaracinus sp.]|nr:hypothetical protein [Sandaracinus sp.]
MRAAAVAFHQPATVDPFEVDGLDDAELDELPFGVVCLDASGTILRYNLAEARMARLDRHSVIGRTFFGEVARCTDVPEFRGRFDAMVQGTTEEPLQRFDFLFDFKFGAQEVEVEMLRAPASERFYLLVHRRRFRSARENLAPDFPAPLQSELVERDGGERGVLRDDHEQRVVHAPYALFSSLLRTCQRVAPETWGIFCREWGVQWGRRLAVELEMASLEATELSLKERAMGEVADALSARLRDQGWGELSLDLSDAPTGLFRLELHESTIAAAARSLQGRACHLVAGMLSAVFSNLADRRLHVEELRCRAQGHAHCEFVVVGSTRKDRVAALAEEGASFHEVIDALGRGR